VKFPITEKQLLNPDEPNYEDGKHLDKTYKLIFFSNEKELLEKVNEFRIKMTKQIRDKYISFLVVFMFIFAIIMTYMLV